MSFSELLKRRSSVAGLLRQFVAGLLVTVSVIAAAPAAGATWKQLCIPNQNGQCGNIIPVSVQGVTTNFNLVSALVGQGWDGTSAVKAIVTVTSGAVIGSTSTSAPAFETGVLPAGSQILLTNYGSILGRGGDGAPAGTVGNPISAGPGYPGGPALRVQYPMSISNYGIIAGGGGGGGIGAAMVDDFGGGWWYTVEHAAAGGGGGGAGYPGGNGGPIQGYNSGFCSGTYRVETPGSVGGQTAGGAGGASGYGSCGSNTYLWGGYGGVGGGLGQAGSSGNIGGMASECCGVWYPPTVEIWWTVGGAPGSVTMPGSNANITWVVPGTRYGSLL